MSVDIKQVLTNNVQSGLLTLPASAFGGLLQTAIDDFLSGSNIQITLSGEITGDAASATVTGTGVNQPFGQTTVTAVFTEQSGDVSLDLSATVEPGWSLAKAWPPLTQNFPFNQITIPSGTLKLEVDPGKSLVALTGALSVDWNGQSMGSGILMVQYDQGTLGLLFGVVLQGSWSPGSLWEPLSALTFTGAGAFFSTIDASNLIDGNGQPLSFPESVKPGLTLYADLELDGSLTPLQFLFGSTARLNLLGFKSSSELSLTAHLQEDFTLGPLTFEGFDLEWNITEKTITLSASSSLVVSGSPQPLELKGAGTLNYSTTPSATVGIYVEHWVNPFGIPNFTIEEFGFAVGLNEVGMSIALGGTISVGSGQDEIELELIASVQDFELPEGLVLSAKSVDKSKSITLTALVDDFMPPLGPIIARLPFINDFGFKELTVIAVDAPFTFDGHTYDPGVGVTGDITFFSYELDFGFSISTSGVSASGSLNKPILFPSGSGTLLTLSDSTGTKGPSGSIDTTASPYFTMDASLKLLGLLNNSITAHIGDDGFSFDVGFSFLSVVHSQVSCTVDPEASTFAGKASFGFSFPDIDLPALTIDGVTIIPSIHLSPNISANLELDLSSSPSDTTIGFKLDFTFLGFSIHANPSFSLQEAETALADLGTFVINWIKSNVQVLFQDILNVAAQLAKLLKELGQAAAAAAEAVAKWFKKTAEEAWDIINDVWTAIEGCAMSAADAALGGGGDTRAIVPAHALVDLTGSDKGQELLFHYYLHHQELGTLLASQPPLHQRLRATLSDSEQPVVPALLGSLEAVAQHGSPPLAYSAQRVAAIVQEPIASWHGFLQTLEK